MSVDPRNDLPDHDGRDLYRIAICVVDLQVMGLEVAHPHADPPARREQQYPRQPLGS
jgi:hypothetical protein